MGRWIERHTSRDLFRAMLEHMPGDGSESSEGMAKKISSRVNRSVHRTWDAACPLFLQRMVFVPQWNRRSQSDVLKNVAIWRGRQHREHRYEPTSFHRLVRFLQGKNLIIHLSFQIILQSYCGPRFDVLRKPRARSWRRVEGPETPHCALRRSW